MKGKPRPVERIRGSDLKVHTIRIQSSQTKNVGDMWLLDTSTLALCSFTEDNVPSYIILSHTWESEEVSFQDIQLLNNPAKILEGKAGYNFPCKPPAEQYSKYNQR